MPSLFVGKGKRGTTGTVKGSVIPEFIQPLPGTGRVFRDPGSWIRPSARISNGLIHIQPWFLPSKCGRIWPQLFPSTNLSIFRTLFRVFANYARPSGQPGGKEVQPAPLGAPLYQNSFRAFMGRRGSSGIPDHRSGLRPEPPTGWTTTSPDFCLPNAAEYDLPYSRWQTSQFSGPCSAYLRIMPALFWG